MSLAKVAQRRGFAGGFPGGMFDGNDPAQLPTQHTYEAIVDPRLRRAKGKVLAAVFFDAIDDAEMAALAHAGTVIRFDRKHKIAIFSGDASALKGIATLTHVTSIAPAE